MRSMMRSALSTGALVVALAGGVVHADETTYCNSFITTLPYTIATQGHYCFDRNLSTAIPVGAAITIAADFVVLDLNNFKLGGGAAGKATDAYGVYALDRNNITVRNGNIRGFAYGILIDASTPANSQNITIESNVLDGNLKVGVATAGSGTTVRNNQISNTGGGTSPNTQCSGYSMGISSLATNCGFRGNRQEVTNNTIVNTVPHGGSSFCASIFAATGGGGASIVANNRVLGAACGSQNAIEAWSTGDTCRDNTVVDSAGAGYDCNAMVGINSDN